MPRPTYGVITQLGLSAGRFERNGVSYWFDREAVVGSYPRLRIGSRVSFIEHRTDACASFPFGGPAAIRVCEEPADE